MDSRAERLPLTPTLRAAPLFLALANLALLVASHPSMQGPALAFSDQREMLQVVPYLAATAFGVGARFARSRVACARLALAMALCLLLVTSSALVQFAFGSGITMVAAACNAFMSFALALTAVNVALVGLAPARVNRHG